MTRKIRQISWIKAALKEFQNFLESAREICVDALTLASDGSKADIAKPLHGLGSGVLEIALPDNGNAYRVVYTLHLATEIWVIHAFQKKSVKQATTPKREIDLIRQRIKYLKETL